MNAIGSAVSGFFDLMLGPLAGRPALAMVAVSVFSAIWALLLFKAVTPQRRLEQVRDGLFGHIYEMGLYQDRLGVLARIQGDLARANLRYLLLTLPALLALTAPMVLTLAQLDSRFAHRPLVPGESTVFSLRMSDETTVRTRDLVLEAPDGVVVDAGPVRDPADHAVAWRLRAVRPGDHELIVRMQEHELARRVVPVGDGLERANEHNRGEWYAPLLTPGAQPLPASSLIEEMTLRLPARTTKYLGVEMDWLVAFMVFSLLAGLALKDVLRVSF